jgi:hypothetical protein
MRTHLARATLSMVLGAFVLAACGDGESIVAPGPGDPEESTTTIAVDKTEEETDEVVTGGDEDDIEDVTTTEAPGNNGDSLAPSTTVVIDENSENAGAYTELAASGLVLTLGEQACADDAAESAVGSGSTSVDAVIEAVQVCASPRAIDDFASSLILAGGNPLPPTESACVSSRLQSTDEYHPFWVALLDEEPFDFLLSDLEVQNRYLDLYTECVSVGRAVGEQANVELSPPTRGCIDDLYNDREFVRVTIEADLSGDLAERDRIDSQIAGCLTSEERDALGAG